jgi:hypothetical protein
LVEPKMTTLPCVLTDVWSMVHIKENIWLKKEIGECDD